ncbi:MAG: GFA family protein [Sphingomicrobium sp.]
MADQSEPVHTGQCFCGAVEVEARGEPPAQGYCHCQSCRSMSGAPLRGFTLWPQDMVRVTRGADQLKGYNKMGFSDRQHCAVCGGQVLIQHPTIRMTDVHSALLRTFDFRPAVHINYQETVLPMRDGLPKLKDLPADLGGSGETLPE